MSKKITIINHMIRLEGVFDLQGAVDDIKSFLAKKQYLVHEKQNLTKDKKQWHELKIKLTGFREIDEFGALDVFVYFYMLDLTKVKVKDKVMDKGKLEVNVQVSTILDYNNKYSGKIGEFLFNLYINFLAKDRMRKFYYGPNWVEGTALFDHIKKSLKLHMH